ncbi:right-handed parallel beta-helix repeat-containing protein [Geminisphaera colitermitum]|uniref:right-handed parallel beta-helix repeat-containing protein n=1 Tax=Geminisphaera colitermitum TaxID=1148786 RepID=UPI000158D15A|nr:right-handed parallel beta-helix repeat-containing protein [Geminisphaera colitermitum]
MPSFRHTPTTLFFLVAATCIQAATTYIVDNRHPAATDTNPGTTTEKPLLTINAAAQLAQPGDTIEIAPGIYRERVIPTRGGETGQPITYRARKPGTVTIKGSDEWHPDWSPLTPLLPVSENLRTQLYRAPLDLALFADWRPHRDPRLAVTPSPFHEENIPSNGQDKLAKADKLVGPPLTVLARPTTLPGHWPLVIGQLYANGQPLAQTRDPDELARLPGSFTVDADGAHILVHLPTSATRPDELAWEITTRESIFAPAKRRLGHIILEDLIFEHAANQSPWPSVGAVSVRNGHDWIIRRCTIRHAASVGLDIGGEWFDGTRLFGDAPDSRSHLIEDCTIHDNGLTGIYGYEVRDVTIRRNEIHSNNRLGFINGLNARWEEYAGIKLLHARRIRIEDNYVHDNHAFGIWFDNQWQGSRISRNLVVGNQFGGIFIEFGTAPTAPLLIDNNIVLFTDEGSGIYCHDASNVIIASNLLYQNKDYGLWMWSVSPRGGTSDNHATANIFYGNGAGNIGYPGLGEINKNNTSDYNLFANKTWARSADAPTFSLHESNSKPSVTRPQVAHQITDALNASGGPDATLPYEHWRAQPARALTLGQWQTITGNDRHSLSGGGFAKALYRPALRQLEIIPHANLGQLKAPVTKDAERDYFGRLRPANGTAPAGPFFFSQDELTRVTTFASYGRNKEKQLIRKDNERHGLQNLILWPKPPLTTPAN